MSVLKRGRRTAVRLAIGLGVLASPFAFAGAAQAAIGLGHAPNLGFRADLLSVHLLSGVNGGRAEWCFDKAVSLPNPSLAPEDFRLMGYRWDTVLRGLPGSSTVLDTSTSTCPAVQGGGLGGGVIVTMTPGADLTQYTVGTVVAGTVTANVSGGTGNIGDSAPVVESTAKAGTRGYTAGNNLQAVAFGAPAGTDELLYTFEKTVDPAALNPTAFGYINAAGTEFTGIGITGIGSAGGASGNVIRVTFGPTINTSDATQAFVFKGGPSGNPALCSTGVVVPAPNGTCSGGRDDSGSPSTLAPTLSVVPVGPTGPASGVSTRPSLVSAEESGTNTMDFVFDQNVTLCGGPISEFAPPIGGPNNCAIAGLNAAAAKNFFAVASNGDETQGSNATVLANGTTVRVTFAGTGGNTNNYQEEIVAGSVAANAVTSANNGAENTPTGKPSGTNVGVSTGYTNAPDANSVVFNSTNGTATVTFDQRVAGSSGTSGAPVGIDGTTLTPLGSWILLDKNGNFLANPTGATVNTTGYISTVTLTFSQPNLLGPTVASALEIVGNQSNSDGGTPATVQNPYAFPFWGCADGTGLDGCPAGPVAGLTPAVYTFGVPHGAGVHGMNPAGNVQQVLAPTYTSAVYAQTKHAHIRTVHIRAHHAKKHAKHHAKKHVKRSHRR